MPVFMVETTYKLPVYRERVYEACSLEHACLRAVLDTNWEDEKADIEASERTFVSGVWEGAVETDPARALSIPQQFHDIDQNRSALFDTMVKLLAAGCSSNSCRAWRDEAQRVLAQADLIGTDSRGYWWETQR
ncbi:hypothetical protein [Rhizobium bangladeshense]|uniref:hypothetical protein n=1 Tax=Rhizobium bangladeshense TaxID=1138189 RepID=UPI001C83FC7F|nr:hypothetical protein [Rhizobium bangladeshense]MBX4898707.1 hypothetical protein [Rhizobium bangladeshense]MBY3616730.1 hypothetical protein [Rhizobium bangladeshense]